MTKFYSSVGKNNWSVSLGNTRNTIASSTRIYQYWSRISPTPLYYMFQFTPPPIPQIPVPQIPIPIISIESFFSYSFLTRSTSVTESLVLENLPIKILDGVFEITPDITITGNSVYVYIKIDTILYNETYYANDLGITFNKNNIVNFYNSNTTNLTMISTNNFPFSRTGSQFSSLNNLSILSDFKPYFLPDTSLRDCFKYCSYFNSDISGWNVSKVINMASMFESARNFNNKGVSLDSWSAPLCESFNSMFQYASNFNQPLKNLVDTSTLDGTCSLKSMFESTPTFNQNISGWDVSNVTTMASMFNGARVFNNGQPSGTIPGTAPLNWVTSKVTTMASMFNYANAFNQRISKSGSYWDTINVRTVLSMFRGVYLVNAFNNGQGPNGVSDPLNWIFDGTPANANWRAGSQLTFENAKTTPQLP